MTAFRLQDLKLIDEILSAAKNKYPSYTLDQLWLHILPLNTALTIFDHEDADNFLWFLEHFPRYASHLSIQPEYIAERSLLLKLEDHIKYEDILKYLHHVICTHNHVDDILFYKKHFSIENDDWEQIIHNVLEISPLDPVSLCILKHKDTILPLHEIPPISLNFHTLIDTSPDILFFIRPYLTPKTTIFLDLALTVMIGDVHSLENILKNISLQNLYLSQDIIYICYLRALTYDHKKLYTRLEPLLSSSPEDYYFNLRKECLMADNFGLHQDYFLEYLYLVKNFSAPFGPENLLILLLESGYFSPNTPPDFLSFFYHTFFRPDLKPPRFTQLSSYLLYKSIKCFLENMLWNKAPPDHPFPPYFFRPISTSSSFDHSLSNQIQHSLPYPRPQSQSPPSYSIYA